MGFKDEFDQHKKESSTSGEFFKFKKDGDYKFRLMSEPIKKVSRWGYGICYEGAPYCQKATLDKEWEEAKAKAKAEGKDPNKVNRPSLSVKWMTWALDYGSDGFVILDLNNKVAGSIREMADSDEYKFEGFPMPYDITIRVKNAGTKEAEYTILASRKNTEVPAEKMEEFDKLTPIQQIKERIQAKQKEKTEGGGKDADLEAAYPDEEINPDDIPF